MINISLSRLNALVIKEFTQILRDRPTFGMIFVVPIVQLVLFGFAINSDPKMLPTALISSDNSVYTRDITAAMQNTGYFRINSFPASEAEADELIAKGAAQFVIRIPEISRAIYCAAGVPPCWSKPTPPTRRHWQCHSIFGAHQPNGADPRFIRRAADAGTAPAALRNPYP